MEKEIVKNIQTDKGDDEFQVRVLRNEGVGLLTTQSDQNYLILDSAELWYDLIQNEYPKKKKCSCKNDWFKIQIRHIFRGKTEDVKEIQITATCTNCQKSSRILSVDIDYSPTDNLIANPITYCKKPKIKYKYQELGMFWIKSELDRFLHFMIEELKFNAYFYSIKEPEKINLLEPVNLERAIDIAGKFCRIYFSREKLEIEDAVGYADEKGTFIKRDLWRRGEVIEFSGVSICELGPLYSMTFGTQYINDLGEVENKSKTFEKDTVQVMNWLRGNYKHKLNSHCFYGEQAYQKYLEKQQNK